jgi:hypothetical protein
MTHLAPPRTDFLGAGLLFGYTYVNVAAHSDWAGPWFTTELPAGRDDPFDAALDVDCAYETGNRSREAVRGWLHVQLWQGNRKVAIAVSNRPQ